LIFLCRRGKIIRAGTSLLLFLLVGVYFHHWIDIQKHVNNNVIQRNTPMKNSSDDSQQKCQRNWSHPKMSQDFLYYRHCRHFSMLLDIPDKCGGPEDIFLLLVIKSFPLNQKLYEGKWIQRIFILGTKKGFCESPIKEDFDDTFFNLTLKQILFLQWMERSCGEARFLFNGDDGVFDNDGRKHLFTGHLFTNGKPERWKGFQPQLTSANCVVYPLYCRGAGFLLSVYTALVIYKMPCNESITIIPIDDAYMGMCLAKANLAPGSHVGVQGWYRDGTIPPKQDIDMTLEDLLLVHRFSPDTRLHCAILHVGHRM
uniref:Hexosyltransferase n=1 Tax=Labrus bergylta TaxID=56723 RepID=A0A3Q3ECU3_9LABR